MITFMLFKVEIPGTELLQNTYVNLDHVLFMMPDLKNSNKTYINLDSGEHQMCVLENIDSVIERMKGVKVR